MIIRMTDIDIITKIINAIKNINTTLTRLVIDITILDTVQSKMADSLQICETVTSLTRKISLT